MGESQDEQEPYLGEIEGDQNGEEKVESTVKEGRFQGGEGDQAKRAF